MQMARRLRWRPQHSSKSGRLRIRRDRPEVTGYSVWVEIADPEKLRPGFNLTPNGMYVNGPGPGRIGLVDFDDAVFDRAQEITLESLQAILRRVSGTFESCQPSATQIVV
jgi:hypothetical protein